MEVSTLSRGIDTALKGDYSDALHLISPSGVNMCQSYNLRCAVSLMRIALGKFDEAYQNIQGAGKLQVGCTIHIACEVLALCGLRSTDKAKKVLDNWRKSSPDDPLAKGIVSGVVSDSALSQGKGSTIDWDKLVSEGTPEDVSSHVKGVLESLKVLEDVSATSEPSGMEIQGDRAKSDELKVKANELYKSKDFEKALSTYKEALAADPTNFIVYSNMGAVYFESNQYDKCIDVCSTAVEKLKQSRSDPNVIARVYNRMALAYTQMKDYTKACLCYEKSLTEHVDYKITTKLKEVKALKKKEEEEAYKDPELAREAREKGNSFFRAGEYSSAVESYTEAIKRGDNDAKLYSNRAFSYIKLMAWYEAEKDCDKAMELDPTFLRAKIRKSQVLIAKKDYFGAIDLLNEVLKLDTDMKHSAEVNPLLQTAHQGLMNNQNPGEKESVIKDAARNPEVIEVLSDPVMQTVIKQISEDPSAFAYHMKDPVVSKKLRTLISSGVLRIGRG